MSDEVESAVSEHLDRIFPTEPLATRILFPRRLRVFIVSVLVIAGGMFLILRRMLETPYAPGVVLRLVASMLLVLAAAWMVVYALRRFRHVVWLAVSGGLAVAAVALASWATVTVANPLGGPVGTVDQPAYLGERFEIVVQEGPQPGRYAVVTGTVLGVEEVALARPLHVEGSPNFDYYADVRCWAVHVELTSRLDERLLESDHDYTDVPVLRPTVSLSSPDGAEATASAWEDSLCEEGFSGRAADASYGTPSPSTGSTTYSFWVTLALESSVEPTIVGLTVNWNDERSYFVPELFPDGCGIHAYCGGLLTLDDRADLARELQAFEDYYWERAAECSPPNVPDAGCGY